MRILAACALLLAACSSGPGDDGPSPDAAPTDARTDDLPDLVPGPLATAALTSTVVSDTDGVTVLDISYRSQDLVVRGRICRPAADGRYHALLLNHGGVDGFGQGDFDVCAATARAGWVVGLAEYRGEGMSAGTVEFCEGEVVDVLNLLEILRHAPYVDPDRVGAVGFSHGGCITMRLAQLGAPLRAIVEFFGPTDLVKMYDHLVAGSASDPDADVRALLARLLTLIQQITGGTSTTAPAAYLTRSVVARPNAFARFPGAVLTVAGTDDPIVPIAQSCALHAQLGTVALYHVATDGTLVASAPRGCTEPAAWRTTQPDPRWPETRYLAVFDGMGHEVSSNAGQAGYATAISFLTAKIP